MGLKRLQEEKSGSVYFKYKALALLLASAITLKYAHHKSFCEFENLERPQFWVPRSVYKWRLEHYKYWELSRLARGYSGTFSNCEYDPVSEFVFCVDEQGKMTSLKFNLDIETVDRPENPLFESYLNAYKANPSAENKQRASRFLAYNSRKNIPLELKNYLHDKPITCGDFIRSFYSKTMVALGLTNFFRYDHLLGKNDLRYEFERLKLALNPDRCGPNINRADPLREIADQLVSAYSTYKSRQARDDREAI